MTAPAKMDLAAFFDDHFKAFAAADWKRYRQFLAAGVVYEEVATGIRVDGPDNMIGVLEVWKAAYPDLNAAVDRIIPFDGGAVVEVTWRGTQDGPLPTPEGVVQPTGIYGEVRAVEIIKFAGDKISEVHHYFDMATALRKGGALRLA